MEVKERPRAESEITTLALPQLGELAQLHQQRLYVIKVLLRCMPHASSMTLDVKATQEPTCTCRAATIAWPRPRKLSAGRRPLSGPAACTGPAGSGGDREPGVRAHCQGHVPIGGDQVTGRAREARSAWPRRYGFRQ